MAELRLYTQRAAGTVGMWLAELHGVREPAALERAAALGRAMQLTNIVRDVGEDLARGRVYLPLDRLASYRVDAAGLARARIARTRPEGNWPGLLEELMAAAEAEYRWGGEALPLLPAAFRRATAVASAVYMGIHDAVRRLEYDTINHRAVTTMPEKLAIAARALMGADRRAA